MAPHLIHVIPGFSPGGAQVRICDLMNYFGPRFRHTVVALNGDVRARERLDAAVDIRLVSGPHGRSSLSMLQQMRGLLAALRPDLVLTYNWGAIEAVMAASLPRLCPVIHTEDGFGPDEARRQKRRRVWFRRFALRFAHCVVAPSMNLTRIMRTVWKLPEAKVKYIPNGIDIARFIPRPSSGDPRDLVVGTVGQLRPEKRQDLLIRACAELARTRPLKLVLAGDGPERARLEALARSLEFSANVLFLGHQSDVRPVYRELDIFCLTSSTEQMPFSILEAMASGIPVVATDVGDVQQMVCSQNRIFVAPAEGFFSALARLAADAPLRLALGAANREHCAAVYGRERMCEQYGALYENALARCGDPVLQIGKESHAR